MNFTALHRLLGLPPSPLTEGMVDEAVSRGIAETDDLDWKSQLPAVKGITLGDFPKDVAAMANRGGGIIIYGVEETQKAATGRCDAGEFDEAYERALKSAAVSAISPPVFGLGVYPLSTAGDRCLAVVVPASLDGPHLIYRNDYFGAPIRNGADTAWMREREIEAMYRTRFAERRHAAEALDNLYDESVAGRPSGEHAWLVAVAHPRPSTSRGTRLTREEAKQLFEDCRNVSQGYASSGDWTLKFLDLLNPRPRLRRWVVHNQPVSKFSRWQAAEVSVHYDGSATLATAVGGEPTPRNGELSPGGHINSDAIELAVVAFLALVRVTSKKLGTAEYEVRVGIQWDGNDPLVIQRLGRFGFVEEEYPMPGGYRLITASVDAAAGNDSYLDQVRDLVQDCLNQAGIMNPRLITTPTEQGGST
ncbi:ATP-binding protein [Nocardia otitidiscaviarum]|nr:ATP-binding protein [Nocardia otitidiscaviarum]